MNKKNETRNINPMFGVLGILGFLGFLGFPIYKETGMTFPFLFFMFFGMFGFFFEGKMSKTLKDERYDNDRNEAVIKALTNGFKMLFAGVVVLAIVESHVMDKKLLLIATEIVISLIIAYVVFMKEFLTYKLDYDEEENEEVG